MGSTRDPDGGRARQELRIAAGIVAGWAILATTTLAWIVSRGGGSAISALARDPLLLFQARSATLWIVGGAGALGILATAFGINQLVGRAYLRLLEPVELPWPSHLPRPTTPTTIAEFRGAQPEAFGFTLLERAHGRWFTVRRQEWILVSSALRELLPPEESEAVIAHELGHLTALDGRYLTFLRTLSRLFWWDPVFALLSRSLTRREELRADRVAAQLTGRPRALARALARVAGAAGPTGARPAPRGLFGSRRWASGSRVEERIQRLVMLAQECSESA